MTAAAESSTPTLVIFGASGDLTKRLLVPGLGSLLAAQPDRQVKLIGADVVAMPAEQWRALVQGALVEGGLAQDRAAEIAAGTEHLAVDLLNEEQLRGFLAGLSMPAVLYFATPPQIAIRACEILARIGVGPDLRLGLEKPFGTDGASAKQFNELLASFIDERQVFRVDHFLATSSALSVLPLRFANRVFKQAWNRQSVASVEIVFDEVLTLEGRAAFYDKTGALIDMIQSHLLLVLALVALEEPDSVAADALRDKIAEVLAATRAWGGDPAGSSRRARYTAGMIGERSVPDYVAEPGVTAANNTDTLAELTLEVDTERWRGVPFTVRSGKAVGADRFEIALNFRPVDRVPDGLGAAGSLPPSRLLVDLGPPQIALQVGTNATDWRAVEPVTLAGTGPGVRLWPYGQVLEGMLDGNPALAVRGDIAEQLWRIVEPVIAAWRNDETPMDSYPAGSNGPEWERPH